MAALVGGAGLGIVVALVLVNQSHSELTSPGGWYDAIGQLCAMIGSYLMLVMVVLIARISWLERAVGQDTLVRWHRRIGGWPILFIGLHIVFVTVGYAQFSRISPFRQLWIFVRDYPDVLAAAVAFGLLVLAGLTSLQVSRRHMKYETWWIVHLYLYVALVLSFSHQVVTGVIFIGHPLSERWWIAVWVVAAAVVLLDRMVIPIMRNLRYQLRVVDILEETPGVYTLTIGGRHLDALAVSGGQFFQWRFVARDLWWHSHPYSLSALPHPPFLRVTVKAMGDQSREVGRLKRGARAFIEGPYGVFTRDALEQHRATLVGAGLGVMPLRALLEDLPKGIDVTVVLRASRGDDLIHRQELHDLVARSGGRLHEVIGTRAETPFGALELEDLAPEIAESDVYICGPKGFITHVVAALDHLKVPPERVHVEEFPF